jgi:Spy/CpxP family protein refolding chaperone
MTRRAAAFRVVGLIVGTMAVTGGVARGQHGAGGHQPGGAGHHIAQECQTQFERVVGEGRGFGLAFAADQNGYPGPQHVLELRERLRLTEEQGRQVEGLLHAMFAESRPKSAKLLDAERRLQAVFAGGRANETAVRTAVGEVERARSEVRLIHLLTHLKTRDLLTEEQRRLYHEARWGR